MLFSDFWVKYAAYMLQIEAKVLPAFLVFVHIVEFDWNWNSEIVACQRHREVWLVYD